MLIDLNPGQPVLRTDKEVEAYLRKKYGGEWKTMKDKVMRSDAD